MVSLGSFVRYASLGGLRFKMDIELFDTTPRDGTQGGELNLSYQQKKDFVELTHDVFPKTIIELSYALSDKTPDFAYDYIFSVPGARDIISTFGSTHKPGITASKCRNMQAMVKTGAKIATIFGKTWKPHISGLGSTPEKYLKVIRDSVRFLLDSGFKRVIYDAEHFFSGFHDDPAYALQTLKAAVDAGADTVVLCDTKGMMTPTDMVEDLESLNDDLKKLGARIGFHGHNDTGCAIANSVVFFDTIKSPLQIQGTVNGFGERCGNTDLLSLISLLIDKRGLDIGVDTSLFVPYMEDVARITKVENNRKAPYVGADAFSHKAGIHIFSQKRGMEYHHTSPSRWGNRMSYLVTSMAGKEMLANLVSDYGYDVAKDDPLIQKLLDKISDMEMAGYKIHNESSENFLLVHDVFDGRDFIPSGIEWRTSTNYEDGLRRSRTIIRCKASEETSSTDKGPVDSQYKTIKKILARQYPYIEKIDLTDFSVGVTNNKGSESAVIVRITFKMDGSWTTQGVSENILEASLQAILKGFKYYILRKEVDQYKNCRAFSGQIKLKK